MKKTIISILILLFIALGIYTAWRTHNGSTDFDTYYYAAKCAVSGESVYTENKGVSPYIYPPFFACLFIPFTFLSLEAASFIWYVMNLFFFVFSMVLCKSLIFGDKNIRDIYKDIPLLPKALFLAVTGSLFIDNISLLQANILLFFAVLAALHFFKNGRPMPGGICLGMAISIKLIPAFFLVYFVAKKEFKAAFLIIVWVLIFTLAFPSLFLGPAATWHALLKWHESMFLRSTSSVSNDQMMGSMFNPVNQSITATLSRWLIKNDGLISYWRTQCFKYPSFMMNKSAFLTRDSVLRLSQAIVYALLFLTILYCLVRNRKRPGALLNDEISLVFLACLISNPFLKTPHFIFIIFPLLFLIRRPEFVIACILYLSISVKLFRIIGFGTFSILLLWIMVIIRSWNLCHIAHDV